MVLTADESGDLDEVAQGDGFRQGKWLSGSLYEDSTDFLRLEYGDESDDETSNVLMFLLSAAGGLQVGRDPEYSALTPNRQSDPRLIHQVTRYSRFSGSQTSTRLFTLPTGSASCHHSCQQNSPSVAPPPENSC